MGSHHRVVSNRHHSISRTLKTKSLHPLDTGIRSGFTVLFFIVGLISTFHYHLILISTAFIGATAFVLGIDCFTRGQYLDLDPVG
jgi:hypothetical protein